FVGVVTFTNFCWKVNLMYCAVWSTTLVNSVHHAVWSTSLVSIVGALSTCWLFQCFSPLVYVAGVLHPLEPFFIDHVLSSVLFCLLSLLTFAFLFLGSLGSSAVRNCYGTEVMRIV
ncbi:20101_t:CDS:2, partial [Gigaspora rosea]